MPVVTVFGQSYCRGWEIAEQVAKALSDKLVLEESLIERTAEEFGASKSKLRTCLRRSFSLFSGGASRRRLYVAYIRKVLAETIAQDNVVYCGLATPLIPKDITHVLRVCLVADKEFRVGQAVEHDAVSDRRARTLVERDERNLLAWGEFLSLTVPPWDSQLHDIVLPMHSKSVEDAVSLIAENAQRPAVQTTPQSRQRAEDFVLASRVWVALAEKKHDVEVTAEGGKVTILLKKYAFRLESYKRKLEGLAKTVSGVEDVEVRIGPKVKTPNVWPPVDIDVPQKVLLVDDEKEFVQTLSERLETRSMSPSIAYNGEEALSLVEKDEPEVMVLDLKMPGIDGIEVLRRVKRDHPRTEVIILTGHGSDREREIALELGAFAYLQKPVDINVLSNTMKEAYARVALFKQAGPPSDDGVP